MNDVQEVALDFLKSSCERGEYTIQYHRTDAIEYIRINTADVISLLATLVYDKPQGNRWCSVVFQRPFQSLIQLHDAALECLQKVSFPQLETYLEFMNRKIMPRYLELRAGRIGDIYFGDLWCMFHVGELICSYGQEHAQRDIFSEGSYRLWRLTSFRTCRRRDARLDAPAIAHELTCYRLDHDGEKYLAVRRVFRIDPYAGPRDPLSLPVFPLRLLEAHRRLKEDACARGKLFTELLLRRFYYHDAWASNVVGDSSIGHRRPDYIKGEVVIDLAETFHAHPTLKPTWAEGELVEFQSIAVSDDTSFDPPVVTLDPWEDLLAERDRSAIPRPAPTPDYVPSEEDFVLLPRSIPVYSIKERRFVMASPLNLKPIAQTEQIFETLKIPVEHKRIIRSLLSSHFQRRELEARGHKIGSQDMISGKGQGLVILLHGSPGVGKTATAEAVARETKRPLFAITCGDLGYTPDQVEQSLKDIFRFAYLWNCVTLLDEADVFLSQRAKTDLKRNALVSVFLRTLEYYSGMLFLTTNRPGTLDEAIKSRVHVSLYYPPLGKEETLEIFDLNLSRLEQLEEQRSKASGESPIYIYKKEILEFAEKHFAACGKNGGVGRWNGRQIRNAFQIASSLALYEKQENPGAQAQLRAQHFSTVAAVTSKYDEYRTAVLGKADDELAYERGERFDDAEEDATEPVSARDGKYDWVYSPSARAESKRPPLPHSQSVPLDRYTAQPPVSPCPPVGTLDYCLDVRQQVPHSPMTYRPRTPLTGESPSSRVPQYYDRHQRSHPLEARQMQRNEHVPHYGQRPAEYGRDEYGANVPPPFLDNDEE